MSRYRVYYNRRGSAPWSVDSGDQATERTCTDVVLCGCYWRTRTLSEAERATVDTERVPVAWIEVEAANAELVEGKIVFVPFAP